MERFLGGGGGDREIFGSSTEILSAVDETERSYLERRGTAGPKQIDEQVAFNWLIVAGDG